MDRRSFGLVLGATLVTIGSGCGGGGGGGDGAVPGGGPPPGPPPGPPVWRPNELFVVPDDFSFDLSVRLPDEVPRGGHFSVAEHGAPLPPGVVLLPNGELRATSAAIIGTVVTGVIFEYTY